MGAMVIFAQSTLRPSSSFLRLAFLGARSVGSPSSSSPSSPAAALAKNYKDSLTNNVGVREVGPEQVTHPDVQLSHHH